ncbi:hypothetical protein [Rhodanobacter sp. FW106-PBR-LB-2-11]|uniref:hypothetical protein n=1 Tax=Rhodanobacter sp. FW106-PBR-LB-2-11 TaxID=1524463 RepID=UPI0034E388AE
MDITTTRHTTAAGLGIAAIGIFLIATIAGCTAYLSEHHSSRGVEMRETLAWFAFDVATTVALAVAASTMVTLWDRLRPSRAE